MNSNPATSTQLHSDGSNNTQNQLHYIIVIDINYYTWTENDDYNSDAALSTVYICIKYKH
jgi:hypothetical protein